MGKTRNIKYQFKYCIDTHFKEGMDSCKNNLEILRRTGSMIETPIFYEHLSAMDNLQLHLDYMEVKEADITETLKMVGLLGLGLFLPFRLECANGWRLQGQLCISRSFLF